ncbi:MAG: hypothetical protein M1817_003651 [Caeruleum heppii]|nr:MAG: hypothetical protein M1817_003651 [Caeruleum heppii]
MSLAPVPNSKLPAAASSMTTNQNDHQHTDTIDGRLHALTENVLPKTPYLLSLPQGGNYRVNPAQADNWKIGVPFANDEEELQYMTFLSRQWEDGILIARGDWEKPDNMMLSTNPPKSGAATPINGKKRKISFGAYKNRSRATTPALGGGTAASSQEVTDEAKREPKMGPKSEDRSEPILQKPKEAHDSHASVDRGLKRNAETMNDTKPSAKANEEQQPSSKKTRPSLSPKPSASHTSEAQPRSNRSVTKLPPLLSPTLPPTDFPGRSIKLPPLLSPTLPPLIEEKLDRLKKLPPSKQATSRHQKSDSLTSLSSGTKSSLLSHDATSSGSMNASRPSTGKDKVSSLDHPSKAAVKDQRHPEVKARPPVSEPKGRLSGVEANKKPSTSTSAHGAATSFFESLRNGAKSSPQSGARPTCMQLIAKLKYGKQNRKAVQRILNMSTRSKKAESDKEEPKGAGVINGKDTKVASKSSQDKSDQGQKNDQKSKVNGAHSESERKTGEKRPRSTETANLSEPPSKRPRGPDGLNIATTPKAQVAAPLKSPAVHTPKKELKSAAMRRVDSSEAHVKTPQPARSEALPAAEIATSTTKKTLSNSDRGRADAWRGEHKRLSELGKRIKVQAQVMLTPSAEGGPLDEKVQKKGAVLAIESVLCYIVAFSANDEMRRIQHANVQASDWRSLLGLWKFAERMSRSFRHIHGVCLQVGAVIHEIIHGLDMERLQHDPLPAAALAESATPEAVAKAAAYETQYLDWRERMGETSRERRPLWTTGTRDLSVEDLQTQFPRTWSKRLKVPLAHVPERLGPGKYDGDFYLPLSGITTGVEAVRATMTLMREWTKKEDVKWETSLKLR